MQPTARPLHPADRQVLQCSAVLQYSTSERAFRLVKGIQLLPSWINGSKAWTLKSNSVLQRGYPHSKESNLEETYQKETELKLHAFNKPQEEVYLFLEYCVCWRKGGGIRITEGKERWWRGEGRWERKVRGCKANIYLLMPSVPGHQKRTNTGL